MRSHWQKGVAALFIATTLAACGGGGSDTRAPTTASYTASSTSVPPDFLPKYPIPANAWRAPASALPTTGNYVYLQSDSGDYIGGGKTYVYSGKTAILGVTADGYSVDMSVRGDQNWSGSIRVPSSLGTIASGYFVNLSRAPFADPAVGGLEWSGEGRGCNTLKGWAIIDRVTLVAGAITEIDARFEQRCEGGAPALRGQIHWTLANTTNFPPEGPKPIPSDLWRADPAAVPATGNYVFLSSTAGDYVGGGRNYLYTGTTANLAVTSRPNYVGVSVRGDQNWTGDFQAMNSVTELRPGYYGDLSRYPFHNALKGGLDWSGDGRGCNRLSGWFVVDAVNYTAGVLKSIDLRFEQHCEGGSSALRGQIRWNADDIAPVPGPVNPPPATLWRPSASFVPPAGNYVYLVSDAGDYIGQGQTQLYTPANATIIPQLNRTAAFGISVGGYSADFVGMQGLSQLTPGYYGDLQRYPFHNALKGGMNFSGNGRGCNSLRGWFTVDSVTYAMGAISSLHMRFEQHCEGGTAALRGVIHLGN